MPGPHTVLLVDDENPIRKALTRVLKFEPYTVLDCGDPFEALEIVKSHPIHLVVSDHTMPGMNGMDLLRKVRLVKPDVVRIILTGNADLDMAMRAINEGAIYRFLTKPWDNNDLLIAIRLGLRHYEIEAENRRLLALVRKHRGVLSDIEAANPGMTGLKKTPDGKILIDDDDIADALRLLEGSLID